MNTQRSEDYYYENQEESRLKKQRILQRKKLHAQKIAQKNKFMQRRKRLTLAISTLVVILSMFLVAHHFYDILAITTK